MNLHFRETLLCAQTVRGDNPRCPQTNHQVRTRQYASTLTLNTALTSLKRFQCFILRLYWEMVDSHCSSSMKFPAFPASFPLFTSSWSVKPASRHRQATTRTTTMLLRQFGQGCISYCCCPPAKDPHTRVLLLLLLLQQTEWKGERERGEEGGSKRVKG